MSSPTRSPCTARPASHSGQWVMGSVPPSNSTCVLLDRQKRSSSFAQGRTKSALLRSRVTTFIRCCLATAPLSSTNILPPVNGGIRLSSTLASRDFCPQLRVLFAVGDRKRSTTRLLSGDHLYSLLVPSWC